MWRFLDDLASIMTDSGHVCESAIERQSASVREKGGQVCLIGLGEHATGIFTPLIVYTMLESHAKAR
jgi:hypothetical protein